MTLLKLVASNMLIVLNYCSCILGVYVTAVSILVWLLTKHEVY